MVLLFVCQYNLAIFRLPLYRIPCFKTFSACLA
jgi:hypothetical protein